MQRHKNKVESTIRLVIIIFISTILLRFGWTFYRYHYNTFLLDVTHDIYKPELFSELLSDPKGKIVFSVLKAAIFFCVVAWLVFLVRTVFYRKPLIAPFFEKWISALAQLVKSNLDYYRLLPRVIKISITSIIILETVILIGFIYLLPYDYDEAYSYLYFSGNGVLSSLVYYPLPNNHVLYNILSSVSLHLPIPVVPATRIISSVSAIITSWYFFKLLGKVLSNRATVIVMSLLVFSYPFLLYATQARGYMLMLLCALLSLYGYTYIVGGNKGRKYYALFVISNIAGLFTIPSFLYYFLIVDIFFFFEALTSRQRKSIWNVLKANLVIAVVTFTLYLPVIWRNGFQALTNNNGVVARSTDFIAANMGYHLRETWSFLNGYTGTAFYFSVVLILILVVTFYTSVSKYKFLWLTAAGILLSPAMIIWVHRTIPFSRTWLYLLLPIYMAIASLLSFPIDKISKVKTNGFIYSILAATILAGIQFWRFEKLQRQIYAVNYDCEYYNKLLDSKYGSINTIGYEVDGLAFYLKDMLLCDAKMVSNRNNILSQPLQSAGSTVCDVLILNKKSNIDLNLQAYHLMQGNDSFFNVFLRRDIYERK